MKTVGIICEYNPFHNGHQRQLRRIRELVGEDTAVVCVMSGDFVQRGAPALYPKELRAETAIRGGANLVLELPVTYALRSAEGFADGGVEILDGLGICDLLSFGCEREGDFLKTAELLDSEELRGPLHEALDAGLPFPAARQRALEAVGGDGGLLTMPNTTLAVEYAKAIRRRGSRMALLPILREGDYHAETPDPEQPSASSLRMCADFLPFVPEETRDCYSEEPQYRPEYGERAILARLRGLTEAEFSGVPFGSEGLWRKVYRACASCESTEEIIRAAKSKRYPYTRLSRLLLCAYLGITEDEMAASAPYVRVLGFDETGRKLLKACREVGNISLLNAGQTPPESAYAALERRCRGLYALFCAEHPGRIRKDQVFSAEKMKKSTCKSDCSMLL